MKILILGAGVIGSFNAARLKEAGHDVSLLAAMAQDFPAGVHWTRPAGGLFIWVTLPQGLDATELLKVAIEQKVAFIPGTPFHPCGGGANTLRLNFTNATPENIRVGIRRLGRVLHEALAGARLPVPTPVAAV